MNGATSQDRNHTLDFVKGILVIVMVMYHAMNVFSTAGPSAYGYIRFVSGSFVFIAGYVIAVFYEGKFKIDPVSVSSRLLVRGVKLVLLFTVLNVSINLTGIGNPEKAQLGVGRYLDNFHPIYVVGEAKYASFQILLPIAYLLMAAPAVLLASKGGKWIEIGLTVAVCALLVEVESRNGELVVLGVLGLLTGMLVGELGRAIFFDSRLLILLCLSLCLVSMGRLSQHMITYAIGVMAVLKLFYDFGRTINLDSFVGRAIILLGRHSLVCYIGQIILLRGLSRALSMGKWELDYKVALICVLTSVVLWVACHVIVRLCNRYRLVEKSYRLVFA
jgi:hypothetical protein